MYGTMQAQLADALEEIRAAGTLKAERPLGERAVVAS